MIAVYAEKPDMGTKFAAALDAVHLSNGTDVSFEELGRYEKQVTRQRAKDGYFLIDYKGEALCVTWGFGHMCGLKQAADYNKSYKNWRNIPLPWIPEDYELKVLSDGRGQYGRIKKIFSKADMIICATDDDREGDLIFDYLYRNMKCHKPFMRVLFNKQTKAEFQKAFQQKNLVPSEKREPVIEAGRARNEADFIIGANLTAALTLSQRSKSVMSVGRVQTAVLNMIVEREQQIENFKPSPFWTITGKFTTEDGQSYTGTHKIKRFVDKDKAKQVYDKLEPQAGITRVSKKEFERERPFLYSLQSLQMDANKKYGFSLDKTLDIAQELYEGGYTTYPRTDSVYLTEDMGLEITEVINHLFALEEYSSLAVPVFVNPRDRHYFDNSKVDSHYAIVPTTKKAEGLSSDELKVYDLIARSVISMVYPKAVMEKISITTGSNGEEFLTTGTAVVKPGFYTVTGSPKETLLPDVSQGQQVSGTYKLEEKKTEPPKRYTDATLLSAMINCGKTLDDEELKAVMTKGAEPIGLGRPSTQAAVVSTLLKRGYIKRDKKTIRPTQQGIDLIKTLPVDDVKSPVMTASWEKRLDDIEHGKDTHDAFMKDMEASVIQWTDKIKKLQGGHTMNQSKYTCPICGQPMIMYDWGLGCSGYKDKSCQFSISGVYCGYHLNAEDLDAICSGSSTEVHEFTSKKGNKFKARLTADRDTQRLTCQFEQDYCEGVNCPVCGKPMRKLSWGYSCSGYPECRFSIGSIGGKELTEDQVKALLKGERIHLDGLQGKKGAYDADISIDLDENPGRLMFHFDDSTDTDAENGSGPANGGSQNDSDDDALPWA